MLAHRALWLSRGARGEVDVGELVGRDVNSEIALGMSLLVCRVDEERFDSGQRLEGLIEHGRAGPIGEHELAAGPGKRPGNAVGRKMRLDG